jgi:hypothetical protein
MARPIGHTREVDGPARVCALPRLGRRCGSRRVDPGRCRYSSRAGIANATGPHRSAIGRRRSGLSGDHKMRVTTLRWAAIACAIALAGTLALTPRAHSQLSANPNWVPIGVSSSATTSTVWFHEPSSRQALACQTMEGPAGKLAGIQCAAGRLPAP